MPSAKAKKKAKPYTPTPPLCAHCGERAARTTGFHVYPNRPDLAHKIIWECIDCNAYVGSHERPTGKPLGRPANAELRRARRLLHERMVDPLWETAPQSGDYDPEDRAAELTIQRSARTRVYAFLADRLGLTTEQTHVAMFDLAECRRAWRALQGVDYPTIRAWWKARQDEKEAA